MLYSKEIPVYSRKMSNDTQKKKLLSPEKLIIYINIKLKKYRNKIILYLHKIYIF